MNPAIPVLSLLEIPLYTCCNKNCNNKAFLLTRYQYNEYLNIFQKLPAGSVSPDGELFILSNSRHSFRRFLCKNCTLNKEVEISQTIPMKCNHCFAKLYKGFFRVEKEKDGYSVLVCTRCR